MVIYLLCTNTNFKINGGFQIEKRTQKFYKIKKKNNINMTLTMTYVGLKTLEGILNVYNVKQIKTA